MPSDIRGFAQTFDPVSIIQMLIMRKQNDYAERMAAEQEEREKKEQEALLNLMFGGTEGGVAGFTDTSKGVSYPVESLLRTGKDGAQYSMLPPAGTETVRGQGTEPLLGNRSDIGNTLWEAYRNGQISPEGFGQAIQMVGDKFFETPETPDTFDMQQLNLLMSLMAPDQSSGRSSGDVDRIIESMGLKPADFTAEKNYMQAIGPEQAQSMLYPEQPATATREDILRLGQILSGGVTEEELNSIDEESPIYGDVAQGYIQTQTSPGPEPRLFQIGSEGGTIYNATTGQMTQVPGVQAQSTMNLTPTQTNMDCSAWVSKRIQDIIDPEMDRFTTLSLKQNPAQYGFTQVTDGVQPGDVVVWYTGRGPNDMHMGLAVTDESGNLVAENKSEGTPVGYDAIDPATGARTSGGVSGEYVVGVYRYTGTGGEDTTESTTNDPLGLGLGIPTQSSNDNGVTNAMFEADYALFKAWMMGTGTKPEWFDTLDASDKERLYERFRSEM